MVNSRGPIEDPSPLACTSRSLLLGETEGVLSYKSTSSLITSSNCWFSIWDIDSHLLFLLKVCCRMIVPAYHFEDGCSWDISSCLPLSRFHAYSGYQASTFFSVASLTKFYFW